MSHSPTARPGLASLVCFLAACGPKSPAGVEPSGARPPGLATTPAITAADLRARLSIYADDSMQGRQAGTPGNVKATDWLAAEVRRLGLEPAGDSGSFFQVIPLVDRSLVSAASIRAGGASFAAGSDFIARDQGKAARTIDGVAVVDGGTLGDSTHHSSPPAEQFAGKLVVLHVAPQPGGAPAGTVARDEVTRRFSDAAGIAVATLDAIGPSDREVLMASTGQLARDEAPAKPAFFYATERLARALLQAGRVEGTVAFMDVPAAAPARNVVAILRGRDPALRSQYVAVGAHNDHIGLAPAPEDHDSLRAWNAVMRARGADDSPGAPTPEQAKRVAAILDSLRGTRGPRPDSVYNGADDDGSGSVSVLEIAEALARAPERPRRSILFVWHTGEELGLLGSDWFTRHPTVPRDSIVAQLNIDMVGRGDAADRPGGGPDYLQLIGSRRLSTELGDLVERVNTDGRHGLRFDYTWDADGHPDNSYCRSDHYMYARFGIPITFFTTGNHRDYHQLTDEIQYIDFPKMARVADLVRDIAVHAADLDHRLVVDKPKPDPEAACKQ